MKHQRTVNTVEDAIKRYGVITPAANGQPAKWSDEYKWMVLFNTPDWFQTQVNGMDGKPCRRIYLNKDMAQPLTTALGLVKDRGLETQLKTFDGCFNIRFVRGTTDQPSTHTYGLALDLNAGENPLNGTPTFSSEIIACFTDAGFTWGGNFKRKDGMHFSFAWE